MKLEIEGFEEIKRAVDKRVWDKAFKAVCNDIAKQAFNETRREIKKEWNINIAKISTNHYAFQSKVTKEIKKTSGHLFIKPARNGNFIEITASSEKGIPLILFPIKFVVERINGKVVNVRKNTKIKPTDKVMIKVKVKKSKEIVLKNAFGAKMKSGHTGIFVRKGEKRLPILEKRVISARSMFEKAGFEKILMKKWNEKASKRMEFWLNRKLGNRF